jgi:hypothetical protein
MLASMLASVEAKRCCVGIGLYLFPHDLCLDTGISRCQSSHNQKGADQHQQQTAADQLIGPNSIEHRLRQRREFPRFETKAGIPPQFALRFCDRDKAGVLGDIVNTWFATLDGKQRGLRRGIDVQRRRPARCIVAGSWAVQLTVAQYDASKRL